MQIPVGTKGVAAVGQQAPYGPRPSSAMHGNIGFVRFQKYRFCPFWSDRGRGSFWTLAAAWLSPTWSGTPFMRYMLILGWKVVSARPNLSIPHSKTRKSSFLGHFWSKIFEYFCNYGNCRFRKLFRVQVYTGVGDVPTVPIPAIRLCIGLKSHFHSETPGLRPWKIFNFEFCAKTGTKRHPACNPICTWLSSCEKFRLCIWSGKFWSGKRSCPTRCRVIFFVCKVCRNARITLIYACIDAIWCHTSSGWPGRASKNLSKNVIFHALK
jgi:hypothetical protein